VDTFRGLAKEKEEYYRRLSNADAPRWNDIDGRGNLSDRALAEFASFFLRVMLDQIGFMGDLLQLQTLGLRVKRYLELEALQIEGKAKARLARLLQAALAQGEIERGASAASSACVTPRPGNYPPGFNGETRRFPEPQGSVILGFFCRDA